MDLLPNLRLAELLHEIGDFYVQRKEPFRAKAFNSVAEQVRRHPTPITSAAQAKRELNGVGASTFEAIDEYFKTGRIGRLDQLRAEMQVPEPLPVQQPLPPLPGEFQGVFPLKGAMLMPMQMPDSNFERG